MTLNIKIEILKVFSFDLGFSSGNTKKEQKDVKTSDDATTAKSK